MYFLKHPSQSIFASQKSNLPITSVFKLQPKSHNHPLPKLTTTDNKQCSLFIEALAKPCKFGRGSVPAARDSLSYGQRGRCPSHARGFASASINYGHVKRPGDPWAMGQVPLTENIPDRTVRRKTQTVAKMPQTPIENMVRTNSHTYTQNRINSHNTLYPPKIITLYRVYPRFSSRIVYDRKSLVII